MSAFTQPFSPLEVAINIRNVTIGSGQKDHKSYLKILYQIFRFIKYGRSNGHSSHFPAIQTIADNSGCSERQVQYFLNSQFFKLLGERIMRRGESTCYRLNEWINRIFFTLERRGVMKNIKDNFDRFHKRFKKFMDNAIISDVEKGTSLQEVLNKLCTKKQKILHPLTKKYCTLADSLSKLEKSFQQPNQPETKPVEPDKITLEVSVVRGLLEDRLKLSEQQVLGFIFKNSLGLVKKAALKVSSWLIGGYTLDHPAAAVQFEINKLKAE